jgi:hypothetical protein
VQLDFQDATLEQYDEMNERIGLLPGGPTGAPEELFHWVAKTDNGLRVIDVWESRQAFERFAQEKLGPVFQRVGVHPPRVQFFQVHNYLAGRRWRH